jgi:predicted Zn-dependent peptidase
MLKQVDDLKNGNISTEEMDATRSRLLARVQLAQDDALSRMMRHLSGSLEGVEESIDSILAKIAAISKDDVVAAAAKVRLDTIFFLKGVTG